MSDDGGRVVQQRVENKLEGDQQPDYARAYGPQSRTRKHSLGKAPKDHRRDGREKMPQAVAVRMRLGWSREWQDQNRWCRQWLPSRNLRP